MAGGESRQQEEPVERQNAQGPARVKQRHKMGLAPMAQQICGQQIGRDHEEQVNARPAILQDPDHQGRRIQHQLEEGPPEQVLLQHQQDGEAPQDVDP